MSHVHVRRFLRALEGDDEELLFGPFLGTVADLSPETPDEDDGLVDASGRPIPRKPVERRPFGFRPPDCE